MGTAGPTTLGPVSRILTPRIHPLTAGGFPCALRRQWRAKGLMTATIRLATPHNAPGVQAIYTPVVRETAISFEWELPTVDDMGKRIGEVVERMPWLVCEHRGEVLGYAYASPHRVRAAYQWSVDVSVYVHARARRSGVGRGLYRSLLALLVLQGFYHAYAGITLPNPASVGLHGSLGFEPVGAARVTTSWLLASLGEVERAGTFTREMERFPLSNDAVFLPSSGQETCARPPNHPVSPNEAKSRMALS
jgi:L-amino acid N-acyltransferase YncA